MIRTVVADDEELVRIGLATILGAQEDVEVVAAVADGAAAVDAAAALEPDVVVMDIRMPELDGLAATRRIVDAAPEGPRILVLTTFDLDAYVFEALRAGASGFLLKGTPTPELVSAVRVVAAGEALIAPSITRRLIDRFARRGDDLASARLPALEELTARERDVLDLVARGRTNAEIADELVVSQHTVKTHVAHVLAKLGVRDRVQAVIALYEAGVLRPGG